MHVLSGMMSINVLSSGVQEHAQQCCNPSRPKYLPPLEGSQSCGAPPLPHSPPKHSSGGLPIDVFDARSEISRLKTRGLTPPSFVVSRATLTLVKHARHQPFCILAAVCCRELLGATGSTRGGEAGKGRGGATGSQELPRSGRQAQVRGEVRPQPVYVMNDWRIVLGFCRRCRDCCLLAPPLRGRRVEAGDHGTAVGRGAYGL